jgi:heptosyltransferase-2
MSAPHRILILRFSSLGDIVLATPLLSALKNARPNAFIALAIKQQYTGLFENDSRIGRVLAFDGDGAHRGPAGLWRFAGEVRAQRFDLVLDMHASLRSRVVCALAGAPTVRYNKEARLRRRMVRTHERAGGRHTVDKYLAVLPQLGIPLPVPRTPSIIVPAEQRQRAIDFMQDKRTKKRLVGINAGARWPAKNWGAPRLLTLASSLATEHDVIIFGDTQDAPHWRATPAPLVNTVGQLTLVQLAALIQQCDVLVTADSGPMHLATAVGVPVVALFGPTHPCLGFTPLGERNIVIRKDTVCSPCSLHGRKPCAWPERTCLDSITVEEVREAVERVLRG